MSEFLNKIASFHIVDRIAGLPKTQVIAVVLIVILVVYVVSAQIKVLIKIAVASAAVLVVMQLLGVIDLARVIPAELLKYIGLCIMCTTAGWVDVLH